MYGTVECLLLCCSLLIYYFESVNGHYKNWFGEAYGNEWVFISDDRGGFHFVNLTRAPEPSSRNAVVNVDYNLFTRKNPNSHENLNNILEGYNSVDDTPPQSAHFNRDLPVKVITHGWMSNGKSDTVLNIKNAYLEKFDVNVVAVDWADAADNYFYPSAAFNTRYVGKQLADFVDSLTQHYDIPGSQIHLIGHSLGAHVMGIAAAHSKLSISRVTGLDPARPLFEVPLVDASLRLDKSDAEFVDTIHTCAGILGFREPLGDVDFYPNGGYPGQPGCYGFQALLETCSHGRSHQYFTDSISYPNGYEAYKCESWEDFTKGHCQLQDPVYMGDAAPPNVTGSYYLHTKTP